ncbi:MAG: glycosyltransferase [Acidobacteriaceae bacterium]|nr:glycosyltransferase [Acidobacteriaceae bacterium]MBV8571522.1 glycosyltransferase [Acidobacteriaceae bacterium]
MASAAIRHRRAAVGRTFQQCPICQSTYLEYEFVVDKSPVCGCQDCGLAFLNPQPLEEAPDASGSQTLSDSALRVHETNAAERIDELIAYSGTHQGPILLIGSDAQLVAAARERGFTVHCFTPAEFESKPVEDLPVPFQACLLFCSLEKVRDPLGTLKKVRYVLRSNGSLMVVSPTTDSSAAKRFGSSWWVFSRSNLFYFSVDTLQNLLIKAGFGDPLISPDRSLVSLNYLRHRLDESPRKSWRYRWMRRATSLSPVLRDQAFRIPYARTRILVRPKPIPAKPVLSVIVPVYNEAPTFVELIEELLAKTIEGVDIEIIIIESNSSDGSRDLVLRYQAHPRVRVILEDKPRGKGHAVRAGLKIAQGDVILFQDADLEYDLNDYDALIAPILQYRNNFVLGSRHNAGRNNWKIRKFEDSPGLATFFNFGHLLFLTIFNTLYSQRLSDPFTMFKVFRRECLYGLSFETNRFDFDYEIVIKLLRKGYKPLELPVNYTSRSISEGKKVTMFGDPITWIRAMLKFRNTPLYEQDRSA